jgi:CheY-like chemotaxis protein
LLAGRKLLLADDSVTIQKVIDLTFADEGVQVVAFGNGREAIENIEKIAPDVVLADVFMPLMNGYEVCRYIKENEKLKHIPVMLLVGSFEPFDEAEARRVGADDTLTKPFQSIRRLIDKVGALVGSKPADEMPTRPADELPTAELPKTEEPPVEEVKLSSQELEISTADTQPLPEGWQAASTHTEHKGLAIESKTDDEQMDSPVTELKHETQVEPADALLDLGDFEAVQAVDADDFVLDLDLYEGPDSSIQEPDTPEAVPMRAFVEPQVSEAVAGVGSQDFTYQSQIQNDAVSSYRATGELDYEDQVHEVANIEPVTTIESVPTYEAQEDASIGAGMPKASVVNVPAGALTADSLSPELIDAIARRAVALLSEKVVQEIAWEVVPDLAELLIKRQLEEKESQPN